MLLICVHRRLKRLKSYECGLPFLDGLFDLESCDGIGLRHVGSDEQQCLRG